MPHGPLEVECGCSELGVEHIAKDSLVEVAAHAVVAFQVTIDRLDACPLAKKLVRFFLLVVCRVFLRDFRYHDFCRAGLGLPSVTPVACGQAWPEPQHFFNLVKRVVYRMAVVFVPERDCSHDEAAVASGDRHLVAKLVFLALLALANAFHFGFVKRIDFVLVVSFLLQDSFIKADFFFVRIQQIPIRKISFRLPDEPPRDCFQLAVSLASLPGVLRVIAEALVAMYFLQRPLVALPLRKVVLVHDFLHLLYYLVCELGIRRERDVLFLHGRVKKFSAASCRSLLVMVVVYTDAFLEDQVHAGFADQVPEVDKFTRIAWPLRREKLFATKILVIGVFLKLLHDGFVRNIADVLQDDESRHEAYRLVWRPHFLVEQF